jgi:hypothetical protein
MCNCLAVLKPFARKMFPLLIPSSKGYGGEQSDGTDLKYGSRRKQRSGSHPLASLDHISHPSHGHRAKHSDDGGIIVTNTYRVDTRNVNGSDSESTKNFIAADGLSREYDRR